MLRFSIDFDIQCDKFGDVLALCALSLVLRFTADSWSYSSEMVIACWCLMGGLGDKLRVLRSSFSGFAVADADDSRVLSLRSTSVSVSRAWPFAHFGLVDALRV